MNTALEHVERMEALVRRLAGAGDVAAMTAEARAIVETLPEPIDPDLLAAREIVAGVWKRDGWSEESAAGMTKGVYDSYNTVKAALAGIKHGREMERNK